MKLLKNSKVKLILVLALLICCFASFAYAEENDIAVISANPDSNSEAVVTEEDKNTNPVSTSTINKKDQFLGGDTVTLDTPTAGNVFIMANTVNINTTIDGNVFIMANKVTFGTNTYIYSDVFVMANEVSVSGAMYDIYALVNKLDLTSKAYVIRDITAASNTLNLSGYIKRNANLAFNTVTIDEANCQIGGDLNYSSGSDSIPNSIVVGETTYTETNSEVPTVQSVVKTYIKDAVSAIVIALIVVLILTFATPKFAEKAQTILTTKPWATLGYGALALIVVPVVCFILFCTVIGIIPAIILLLAYIFVLSISSAIISIPVGRMLCQKMKKDSKGMSILMAMVAFIVIWLVRQLPIIGGIATLFANLFALGLIINLIFDSKSRKKDSNVIAKETVIVEKKEEK